MPATRKPPAASSRPADARSERAAIVEAIRTELGVIHGCCELAAGKRESGAALARRMAVAIGAVERIVPLLARLRGL